MLFLSDRKCARQQRDVYGDSVNISGICQLSLLNILRCRIACMYTKKLSEFLRESEDDSDKEPAKSHRMQASIAKKVIDNRLNMTP